jgi:hypothetical protein
LYNLHTVPGTSIKLNWWIVLADLPKFQIFKINSIYQCTCILE